MAICLLRLDFCIDRIGDNEPLFYMKFCYVDCAPIVIVAPPKILDTGMMTKAAFNIFIFFSERTCRGHLIFCR